MAQLTKLGIQNFGIFEKDIEIEFKAITLIPQNFPINVIKEILLSFFATDVIVNKSDFRKYISRNNPLIISFPFDFIPKKDLTIQCQYNNECELSSFKIISLEGKKKQLILELTKKRISINLSLLREWYNVNLYLADKNDEKEDINIENSNNSIDINTLVELLQQIKDSTKEENKVIDDIIYETLEASLKSTKKSFNNIETIIANDFLNGKINLLNSEVDKIYFVEFLDLLVDYKKDKTGSFYFDMDKMPKIINTISSLYSKNKIIVIASPDVLYCLQGGLRIKNVLDEKINFYAVIKKSTSLILYPDEQTKLKSENIELKERVNKFETQLLIETYNENVLLKKMKLSKQSIILSDKILNNTIEYLKLAKYLMANMGDNPDYSPVVLQYGKAVENELVSFFNDFNIYLPAEQKLSNLLLTPDYKLGNVPIGEIKNNKPTFTQCQCILQAFKKFKTTLNDLIFQEFKKFAFNSKFKEDDFFKINYGGLDKDANGKKNIVNYKPLASVIEYRNIAAHAGEILKKEQAEQMEDLVFKFFKQWISAKN